jgi:hypothetical protein
MFVKCARDLYSGELELESLDGQGLRYQGFVDLRSIYNVADIRP